MLTAEMKLNQPLLPALLGLLIILQLTVPFQGWMILLVGLGGAWLVAFCWARSLARGLRLVREMRFGWAQVGDHLEERFTLVNHGLVPAIWIQVRDHSTLPDHQTNRVTGVDEQSDNRWNVKSVCKQRGVFTLGPTTLITGDPFGIYTVELNHSSTTNMVVMPAIVPLPNIQVAPGGRAGEGQRRTATFERTVNAATVRNYQSGDTRSSIHWRTTARRDELYVRLFDSTPSSNWWIILDLDVQVQAGAGERSTIEHGIILAASLADRGLRLRRAVGLIACAAAELIWLPPRETAAQRWAILRALAQVSAGTRSLGDLLAHIQPSLKDVTSLVIITPAVSDDWISNLLPLRRRGIVPTVLLLDPISFGGRTDACGTLAMLADLEITHYLITADILDRPEMRPGRQGHWDWQTTPQGRAILKGKLQDTRWHEIVMDG